MPLPQPIFASNHDVQRCEAELLQLQIRGNQNRLSRNPNRHVHQIHNNKNLKRPAKSNPEHRLGQKY